VAAASNRAALEDIAKIHPPTQFFRPNQFISQTGAAAKAEVK